MADREPVLREVLLEDCDAVAALKQRVGMSLDSQQNWQRLWKNNPALSVRHLKLSMGWVLEVEDRIVGYIGSIPLLCRYGDETLLAAAATGFAVDPAHQHRGYGTSLASAFFKQGNVDMLLNTTANEAAGRIFQLFRGSAVPQKGYDKVLFWVLDPCGFLTAVLRWKKINPALERISGKLFGILLRGDIAVRKRSPYMITRSTDVGLLDIDDIGDEFDDLWCRKLHEGKRLLSYRTAEVLRWHFEKPVTGHKAKVVCSYVSGKLAGYAVIMREDSTQIGLTRSRIVDIFAERDDPQVIDQLLLASYEYAKDDGSHVLEMIGFPRAIREQFLTCNPYSRKLPSWPYFYKVLNGSVGKQLENEDAWYACSFDGDASL